MKRNIVEKPLSTNHGDAAHDEFSDENKHAHIKSRVVDIPDSDSPKFSWAKLWAFTGPGWLMSVAYLDPGNVESDLQGGTVGGYQLIWVLWWATFMGLVLQMLSCRLGVVTGRNLAQICRIHYPLPIRISLWLMMELAIIASDIQEVIGSAIAISVLSDGRVPLWAGSLITAVDTFLFLFLEQAGLRKLEAFFASLISVMCLTFGYMYVLHPPDQIKVLKGLVIPEVSGNAVDQAIGIVGAVIMPHNLYLHSALVTSRNVDTSSVAKTKEANFYNAIESSMALLVSFIINLFVLGVFAHAFYGRSEFADIDLLNASTYLYQEYGIAVKYIWGLGLLAAGQASTMTGTYAGQFVMEGFLKLRLVPWKRVALTRSVAMVPTVLVAVFASSSTLSSMNEWLNVLQSVMLPFALVPVLHFTSIEGVMRKFVNPMWLRVVGWIFGLCVIIVNIYLVYDTVGDLPKKWYVTFAVYTTLAVYLLYVAFLSLGPLLPFGSLKDLYKAVQQQSYEVDSVDDEPSEQKRLLPDA